jgi:hypothetical protein
MRHRFAILSASALLLAVPTFAHAQKATRTPAPTMEALIKQIGETYKTSGGPSRTWYVITMVSNGKGANIGLCEDLNWLGQQGLSKGRVETQVIKLSAAPTPQLIKAMAAFNDKLPFGSVIADESGVYYVHDFIMNGMLPENLATEVGVAFFITQNAIKEFSAYVE